MNAADLTAWARLWRAAFGVPVLVTAATADLLEDIGVDTLGLEREGVLFVWPH